MKAKFLKRSESEKSDKVKVIFEVEGSEVAKAMQLNRAEVYDIEVHEPKLPGAVMTPQEQIIAGLRLITEAVPRIPEKRQPTLGLSQKEDKIENKCANCQDWKKKSGEVNLPRGVCHSEDSPHYGEFVPIYHWCSYHRSYNEEDKGEEGGDTPTEQGEVREQVAGEARTDEGVSTG